MDENAGFPSTNTQQQNTAGTTSPVGSSSTSVAAPVQPAPSQPGASAIPVAAPSQTVSSTQPAQQPENGTRLTLADLYGPSAPNELQQQVATPVPSTAPIPAPETSAVAPVSPAQPLEQNVLPPQVPVSQVTLPVHAVPESKEQVPAVPTAEGGGSHFATILRFIIGGIVVLIVLLLIWGLSSLLFSGRGTTGGKVTITYWGLWEDANVMQPIIADFEKQHPNITVVYTKEDPKDYTKRLLTRVQQGTGPDIFRFHNTWVYPLQSLLSPLPTSVIDTKQLQSNYPQVVSTDLVRNGAIYGLPLGMDTLSLFVNTDIFQHAGAAVPTTWDNFITVAKALTVKDPTGKIKTAGAAIGAYENILHAPDITSLLFLQNGADLMKLDKSKNASDALTFYTTFAKSDSNVWDATLDNSLNAFAAGKVAMYFGYSYDIFAIKAMAPSLHFSIYPVPHLPNRDMTIASYWVEGVSNRSKHQQEALQFMQYLAQKDTQTKIYTEEAKSRMFGELYARTDLASGLSSNPLLAPFVAQYKDAASSFFSGETQYDEYNGALNRYLGNAINSMIQNTSVESAMTTLAQGVSQVMSTYAPKTQ